MEASINSGFCGYGPDFCGTGCVSNCSGGNSALQRIIGYYESWATARPCSACAFASIDGDSFRIVPASPSDVDLYTRTTALKQFNPDFQVFISVGGWAFNDPPTQNIFSDLAANSNNRQAFINSLISFLQTYAFDGIDIDWEYPVAPERGGSSQDKENFVTLLRELRMAFDKYDLHGTWDGTDPSIGLVVNAHRPANAGPCRGSPGTLSYSGKNTRHNIGENLTATWDRTAAVKYIVWNNDQWVSYDDKDTFGQVLNLKLDFANNLCLGGVMVWSADQDDSVGTDIASLAGNAPQLECR
ncbi:glycoside hydrolase family 18 protein [Sphaerobolus stellatus SS14]|uniref:Glycoside hydrolase family 18 protein n=1 Tax=Sphaerobolus stellatus (strain SS14) TaxID=990650 RepID=A0A0C9U4K8_SPHS4|nr:glycoside hydrolase family 18 protein [Sphaerobolus stellatus SS14]